MPSISSGGHYHHLSRCGRQMMPSTPSGYHHHLSKGICGDLEVINIICSRSHDHQHHLTRCGSHQHHMSRSGGHQHHLFKIWRSATSSVKGHLFRSGGHQHHLFKMLQLSSSLYGIWKLWKLSTSVKIWRLSSVKEHLSRCCSYHHHYLTRCRCHQHHLSGSGGHHLSKGICQDMAVINIIF